MPAMRAPGISCAYAPSVFARAAACTVGSVLYQDVLTEAEVRGGGCPALRWAAWRECCAWLAACVQHGLCAVRPGLAWPLPAL